MRNAYQRLWIVMDMRVLVGQPVGVDPDSASGTPTRSPTDLLPMEPAQMFVHELLREEVAAQAADPETEGHPPAHEEATATTRGN